jgi:predicted DNA-binding transcriptional regulator YafY
MPADYSKVQRLLQIVTLLQSREPGHNAKRLAAATKTTERSIYRDLEDLNAAGVPVEFDRKLKGYAIAGNFFLPPLSLQFDEALALIAMAEHVGGRNQVPHLKPAAAAAQKLRSQLAPHIRDQLSRTAAHVAIKLAAPATDENEGDFEKISRAIELRWEVLVDYVSAKATGGEPFRLRPYALLFNQRAWYVIGFSARHNAIRNFKLSRFTQVKATSTPYELPKTWSLDKHLGNAWRMIRGDRTHDVELHFKEDFADTVEETRWHKTQKTEPLDNGDLKFTATVDGLDEIVWWILSMGPNCKVIRPPELAERVKTLATEIAGQYR